MVFAGLLGAASLANAQTAVWQGNSGDTWGDGSAWEYTGVPPTSSTNVEFDYGANSPSVVDANYSINSLTIYGDLQLTTSGSYTISTALGVYDQASSFSNVSINAGLVGTGGLTVNSLSGDLELNSAGASTYSGETDIVTGTLSDGQANSFSPNSIIKVGPSGSTLQVNFNETIAGIGDYSVGGGNIALASNATLKLVGTTPQLFSGVISGQGGLELGQNANLTLANVEAYTGPTTLDAGSILTLGFTPSEQYATLASPTIQGSGTIIFNDQLDPSYSGTITGSVSVVQEGSDPVILTGTHNDYSGNTVITYGTLEDYAFGSGSNFSPNSPVLIDTNGTLSVFYPETIGGNDPTGEFTGSISGVGGIDIAQNAQVTLSGTNTYTGTTAIENGAILTLGDNGSNTGSLEDTTLISGAGTLAFNNPGDSTVWVNAPITGTLSVVQEGNGTTVLANSNNTYSGDTIITNGVLQDNSDSDYGSLSSASVVLIDSPGELDLYRSETIGGLADNSIGGGSVVLEYESVMLTIGNQNPGEFTGTISGAGGIDVASGANVILAGPNYYYGPTVIESGATLTLGDNGSNAGSLQNTSGISGNDSGAGTLAFNNPVDTTTLLSAPISGPIVVMQEGGGTTTLSGGNYNNTYTGNTIITAGTLQDDPEGSGYNFSAASLVQIDAPGTLQVNQDEVIGGLEDYGLGGGSVVLNSSATLTIDSEFNTSFSGVISGSGNLSLTGNGTLYLSGANSYSGLTIISYGTLADGAPNAFSPNSPVVIDYPGTLAVNFDETIGGLSDYTFGGGSVAISNGTLTINGSGTETYSGTITGPGNLTLGSPQVLVLTGSDVAYTGSTTLVAGSTLQLGRGSYDGASEVNLQTSGVSGSGTLAIDNAFSTTLGFPITGAVSLVQEASYETKTLSAAGQNNYSGSTIIMNDGTLTDAAPGSFSPNSSVLISDPAELLVNYNETIGGLADDGGGSGYVVLNGSGVVLTINANNPDGSFSGVISGAGGIKLASGTNLYLTGTNTYTGPTTLQSSSSLNLGDGSMNNGSLSTTAVGGAGYLIFNNPNATTFPGTIGGSVWIDQTAPGTTTFSSANTTSGETIITDGALADGVAGAFSPNSAILIDAPGALIVNHNESVPSVSDYTEIGGTVTLGSGKVLTLTGPSNSSFSGMFTGQGALAINSPSATTTLSGQSTFSGGTTVNAGEVFLQSSTDSEEGSILSGPLGLGDVTLVAGAVLSPLDTDVTLANNLSLPDSGTVFLSTVSNESAFTSTGIIAGLGGIEWRGAGALTLMGNNTFSGGVTMDDGSLYIGSDSALGTGTLTLENGTTSTVYGTGNLRTLSNAIAISGNVTLGQNDNNTLVLTGPLSGTGSLTYAGGTSGILELNPTANTVTGTYTISSGQVIAQNNSAFGSASNAVDLTGGATLNVASGVTVSNPLTFSGSSNVLAGSGTFATAVVANSSVVIAPLASPGFGPGNLTFSSGLEFDSGSAISFKIEDANGTAGSGYSLITATGGLSFSAAANTITFDVVSTTLTGGSGPAVNFNAGSPYSWMFATSNAPITGFNSLDFNVVTTGFQNSFGSGVFSVSETGDNLYLNFTPVPEPSTWALMGIGAAALGGAALRRRRSARA